MSLQSENANDEREQRSRKSQKGIVPVVGDTEEKKTNALSKDQPRSRSPLKASRFSVVFDISDDKTTRTTNEEDEQKRNNRRFSSSKMKRKEYAEFILRRDELRIV